MVLNVLKCKSMREVTELGKGNAAAVCVCVFWELVVRCSDLNTGLGPLGKARQRLQSCKSLNASDLLCGYPPTII